MTLEPQVREQNANAQQTPATGHHDPLQLSVPTAIPLALAGAPQAAPGGHAPATPDAAAAALHSLIEGQTVRESTTGSPATLLVGVEAAADVRLGSTRKLVRDEGWLSGPRYASLEHAQGQLLALLERLRHSGELTGAVSAYERRYGQNLYAVLGERLRDPNERQRALALLPAPIPEAQLTQDAFLEQLAVGMVYQNEGAADLQGMAREDRRASSPHTILETFGFQAGPPVSGKWGFQMRVFLPVQGKARWPNPIVAFRGTEGIQFDADGQKAARQQPEPGHPLDPARVGKAREGTLDTVVGDAAPAGVGYNQFEQNAELIARVVAGAHAHGALIMVGHSLGGALAQLAAARFVDQTARCVTFQSPGIDRADVERVRRFNSAHADHPMLAHHYRIDGDVVPTAGEANLPGEIHYFDRVTRPKGSGGRYDTEALSFDTLNLPRATAGHVSPMLSTYLRGGHPQGGALGTLAASGLHDEGSLGPHAQDVGMVYGGRYSADRDPRLNQEAARRSKGSFAMRHTDMYEAVYYENIAYNTLLERVEGLASGGQARTFAEFRTAAVHLIQSSDRLPLSARDRALGQQFQLPATETDYAHPIPTGAGVPVFARQDSRFTEMQRSGVEITGAVQVRVRNELIRIWQSWHPEGSEGRSP